MYETEALGLGFGVAFFAIYFIVLFGVALVMYLLESIGVYKMSKNMGLSNPWMAFVPIANHYALGRIAEKYIKNDGRPSAKFSKILLTLCIITLVVAIAFVVFIFVLVFLEAASIPEVDAVMYSEEMAATMAFTIILPILLGYLVILGVSIAFSVVWYVALWRVFALYDDKNATVYLVLSIFFGFLCPIFLFMLRNRQPKFTLEQRINIM